MKKKFYIGMLVVGLILSITMVTTGVLAATGPSGELPFYGGVELTISGSTPTPTGTPSGSVTYSIWSLTSGSWVDTVWVLSLNRGSYADNTFAIKNNYSTTKVVTPTCNIGSGFSGITASWLGLSGGSITIPAGATAYITLRITASTSASGSDVIGIDITST